MSKIFVKAKKRGTLVRIDEENFIHVFLEEEPVEVSKKVAEFLKKNHKSMFEFFTEEDLKNGEVN